LGPGKLGNGINEATVEGKRGKLRFDERIVGRRVLIVGRMGVHMDPSEEKLD